MRSDEYFAFLAEKSLREEERKDLRAAVPLGVDAVNEPVLSQLREHSFTPRHTCVTGMRRTNYIKRLILSLSRLYDKTEANFLILSPRSEYGELLRLQSADITVPFIRSKTDLENALLCVKELLNAFLRGEGYPRLIVVLDGLEEIAGCNANGDFEEYRIFFDLLTRKKNVEIISGAELMNSIFSGNPGVFVGVGNCLVTTREEGKADVTYVDDDSSLSTPTAMSYPDAPSVLETIISLNALSKKED